MTALHDRYLATRRFESLDGLRALSILGVIWHHTAPSWVGAVAGHIGAEGVSLFFAISGFLITTLLLRERGRRGVIDLKAFYLRRSLRIFPLYYATLLVYVVMVWALERSSPTGQAFFEHLVYFATYTSNLFVDLQGRVIFYFSWSLAAEEQFYLVWPAVLIFTRTRRHALTALALMMMTASWGEWTGNRYLAAIPSPLLCGVALALALDAKPGFRGLQRLLGHAASPLAVLVLLAAALIWGNAPRLLVGALMAGLVGCCVIQEQHGLAALLRWRPLAYIGSISYGMYMLHMLCKNFIVKLLAWLQWPSDSVWMFGLTSVAAVIAATLSWRWFESRILALKVPFER
jgi:peptidoglycan/LPS O-acetylase OafA/YrhL